MKDVTRLVVVVFLAALLSSCQKDTLTLWVAKKETQLYKKPSDELKEGGVILAGVACVPGMREVEKVYEYVEVLCQDGQYGWIVDQQNFNILSSNPK
jgi:hypothetical protein